MFCRKISYVPELNFYWLIITKCWCLDSEMVGTLVSCGECRLFKSNCRCHSHTNVEIGIQLFLKPGKERWPGKMVASSSS